MTFRMSKPSILIWFAIFLYGAVGAMFPIMAVILSWGWGYILFFALLCIGSNYPMFYLFVIRRVVVSEQGVEYKALIRRYRLSWDEIKVVGVGHYLARRSGAPPMIYFTTRGTPKLLITDNDYKSDNFIAVQYRKKVLTEVLKFWEKDIHMLSSITGEYAPINLKQ